MDRDRLRSWLAAPSTFVVFSALYLATPTGSYTFDAVSYATDIRWPEVKGVGAIFHQHHLLFNALGMLTWKAGKLFSSGLDPLSALQKMNALLGGLGLAVIFLVLSAILSVTAPDVTPRRRLAGAMVATAFVGVSFGWWVASTDGRVNIPPMGALVGSFYFAWQAGRTGRWRSAAASGALAALAALLHQSHGMFILVVGAAAMLAPLAFRKRLMLLGASLGAFIPTLGLPYFVVLRLVGAGSASAANRWALAYAHRGVWWSFDIAGNLPKDVDALVHAVMASPTGGAATAIRAGMLVAAAIVAVALAVDAIVRQATCPSDEPDRSRFVFNILTLVWVVVYSAFFTVWSPGYFVFWIPMAAAIVLAVTVNWLSGRLSRAFVPVIGVAAAVLLGLNLTQHILPNMDESRNKYVVISRSFGAHTPKDSRLIVCGTGDLALLEVYIPYFSERGIISVNQSMMRHGPEGMKYLLDEIAGATNGGGKVYVLGDVIYSDQCWGELESRYWLRKKDVIELLARWDRRPAFTAGRQRVFELKPYPPDH